MGSAGPIERRKGHVRSSVSCPRHYCWQSPGDHDTGTLNTGRQRPERVAPGTTMQTSNHQRPEVEVSITWRKRPQSGRIAPRSAEREYRSKLAIGSRKQWQSAVA